jgi:hypothetical protein
MTVLPGNVTGARPPGGWRDRLEDWSVGRSSRVFLTVAVPWAMCAGVFFGLSAESVRAGVNAAAFFGGTLGVFLTVALAAKLRRFQHLSRQQLREVAAAVRNGRPVQDPRLAADVIEYVNMDRHPRSSAMWAMLTSAKWYNLLLASFCLFLIVAAAHRDVGATIAWLLAIALQLRFRRTLPALQARRRINADRALAAAQAMVQPPFRETM